MPVVPPGAYICTYEDYTKYVIPGTGPHVEGDILLGWAYSPSLVWSGAGAGLLLWFPGRSVGVVLWGIPPLSTTN